MKSYFTELELYDVVDIKIESKEDKWAIVFLNCLNKIAFLDARQTVRELPVFGEPFQLGVFVNGIIDELHFNEMGQLELSELKTRANNSLPSKAQHNKNFLQVMLYSIMFNDLLEGKLDTTTLLSKFHLNGLAALSEDVVKFANELRIPCSKLIQLADLMLSTFKTSNIPKISSVVVEYCSQFSHEAIHKTFLELDEGWAHSKLVTMLPYWKGERETIGVEIEEAWKCHRCEFADTCFWRMKKDEECRKLN